jgi:hypothetical protein
MGHCEMLLAVAGMSDETVAEKTRTLAAGGETAADKVMYAFIRKQAAEPWAVTDADVSKLTQELGKEKAWQVIWWAARCHYMTKVADAFQLPLEQDNPFRAMPGAKPAK